MLHRTAFWLLDLCRGAPILRHLRDIASQLEAPNRFCTLQTARLHSLIRHAAKSTQHYRRYDENTPLGDFAVLTKQEIQSAGAAFLSSAYSKNQLTSVKTSGSYGAPLEVFHSSKKRSRRLAELLFFSSWANYRIGDKHALIRTTRKGTLRTLLQNEIWMDPTRLEASDVAECVRIMRHKRVRIAIGYASVLGELARYSLEQGYPTSSYSLRGVIATSEPLREADRAVITAAFGTPVLSRYATEEFGVVAHEHPSAQGHIVNSASYVVEVLELHRAVAVAPGAIGRVVVTDLFSHAMPLIRYETGDLACRGATRFDSRETLDAIEGKQMEAIFDADGLRVSPHAINVAMKDFGSAGQYQLAQVGPGKFELRVKPVSAPDEHYAAAMKERLLPILGTRAVLRIVWVDSVAAQSSGKSPFIVNEYRSKTGADLGNGMQTNDE